MWRKKWIDNVRVSFVFKYIRPCTRAESRLSSEGGRWGGGGRVHMTCSNEIYWLAFLIAENRKEFLAIRRAISLNKTSVLFC